MATAPPTTEELQQQIADLSTQLNVSTVQITGDIAILRADVGSLSTEVQDSAASSDAKLDAISASAISLQTAVAAVASDVTSLRFDVSGFQALAGTAQLSTAATQATSRSLSIPDRTRIFASLQPYRRNGAAD